MSREMLRQEAWAVVQNEARLAIERPQQVATLVQPEIHERIVSEACRKLMVGSYRDPNLGVEGGR